MRYQLLSSASFLSPEHVMISWLNMEIATSIEQSEKLLGMGVNPKTADMYWANRCYSDGRDSDTHLYVRRKLTGHGYLPILSQDTPAWSLTALMKLMLRPVQLISRFCVDHTIVYRFVIHGVTETKEYINPVDAAIEMIEWLYQTTAQGDSPRVCAKPKPLTESIMDRFYHDLKDMRIKLPPLMAGELARTLDGKDAILARVKDVEPTDAVVSFALAMLRDEEKSSNK